MWESSGGTPDGGSAQRRCTPAGSPCSNTRNNPPHLCRLLVSIPSAEYPRRSHPWRSILCAHIRAAHASGNPREKGGPIRPPRELDTYLFDGCPEGRTQLRHAATKGWEAPSWSKSVDIPCHLHFSACATSKLGTRGASATRHFSFRTTFPPSSCTLFSWSAARNALVREKQSEGADAHVSSKHSVQGPDIQGSGMLSSSGETLAGSIEAQWHTQRIVVIGIIWIWESRCRFSDYYLVPDFMRCVRLRISVFPYFCTDGNMFPKGHGLMFRRIWFSKHRE